MIEITGCADAGCLALRSILVVTFPIDYTFHRTIP